MSDQNSLNLRNVTVAGLLVGSLVAGISLAIVTGSVMPYLLGAAIVGFGSAAAAILIFRAVG